MLVCTVDGPRTLTPGVSAEYSYVDRIFVAFQDALGDNLMLRDVVNAMGRSLSSNRMEIAGHFFDLYDGSGSGQIGVSEVGYRAAAWCAATALRVSRYLCRWKQLVHMLLCSKQRQNESAAAVIRALKNMDEDGNGEVDKEEFTSRAMREPEVMQAMFRYALLLVAPWQFSLPPCQII